MPSDTKQDNSQGKGKSRGLSIFPGPQHVDSESNIMSSLNPYLFGEDQLFYQNIKDFAREQILPDVTDRDETGQWSEEIWKKMGAMGLNGIAVPEQYGGQGAGCLQCCIASEALSAGSADGGLALAWGAHTIIGTLPIVLFGSDSQKEKYLPRLASGEWIAGLGLTEPGSGSDAASLSSRASEQGDNYVVRGSKMFITNGPVGHIFVCMIRTRDAGSRGPMGISAFIIEKDFPGFSVGKILKKTGMHTSTTSELVFDDMHVPGENLLGPLHSGFIRIGRATLEWERTVLVATSTGMQEFVLEQSLAYARQRIQFGKPILNYFAIREKIAQNWIFLMAERRYIYYVARAKDDGQSMPMQASILKLLVTEQGEDVAREGIQIHGGYGYMKEYHVERPFRDSKLGTIGAGSSEVMRSIVASSFPGYAAFMQSMEEMEQWMNSPTTAPKKPEGQLNSPRPDAAGELAEDRLLGALGALIERCGNPVRKSGEQSLEFAFADLIMLFSALKQAAIDCAYPSAFYSVEQKKNDRTLLSYFLLSRYFRSIHRMRVIAEQDVALVMKYYFQLDGIEEKIRNTVDFLIQQADFK